MLIDFFSLSQQCAPQIAPVTMAAVVRTESQFNPYAIGVVHGRLLRQPSNMAEAIATTHALEARGWNFSVGLAQVNRVNWFRYGVTEETAFDPCLNLAVGASILQRCFNAAHGSLAEDQVALQASLSCYASGDFATGYRTGYVQRVVSSAQQPMSTPKISVPAVMPIPVVPLESGESLNPLQGRLLPKKPRLPVGPNVHPGEERGSPEKSAVVF